ncbi:unnamed protein product [Urochloa humidicola]
MRRHLRGPSSASLPAHPARSGQHVRGRYCGTRASRSQIPIAGLCVHSWIRSRLDWTSCGYSIPLCRDHHCDRLKLLRYQFPLLTDNRMN